MNRQLGFSDERENLDAYIERINQSRHPISFLLDGLTDNKNIGMLFRLADAARIENIYLHQCNFSSNDKKLSRVARSTDKYVPYQIIESVETIQELKTNHQLVALEITSNSIPYSDCKINTPMILIIGSEKFGVSDPLLQLVNQSVHIPMYGVNTSMNVAVATGIVTYSFLNNYKK